MKTYLTYGFGIALLGFIWTLIEFFTGLHSEHIGVESYARMAFLIVAFIGLWLGIKNIRETSEDTSLTYGRGVGAGSLISLFWAIGGAVGSFIYVSFINPGFIDAMVELQTSKLEAKGISSQIIDAQISMMRKMMTPIPSAIFAIIFIFFTGFVFSLIIAAILKRAPKETITSV